METVNIKEIAKDIEMIINKNGFYNAIIYLEIYGLALAYKQNDLFKVILDSTTYISFKTTKKLSDCLDEFIVNDLTLSELSYIEMNDISISICEVENITNEFIKL